MIVKRRIGLSHVEDLILSSGYEGAKTTLNYLEGVAGVLAGDNKSKVNVTTKWDGCIHPDTLLVTSEGFVPIKDIIDNVHEFQILQHNFDTGKDEMGKMYHPRKNTNNKNWVEVQLENGGIIRTTSDHEFYTTNRGWVQAKDLTENDDIKESDD